MDYEIRQYGGYTLKMLPSHLIAGEGVAPKDEYGMAEMLKLNYHFATSKNRILYWYRDGVYKKAEETNEIYKIMIAVAVKHNLKWSSRKDNEAIDYLIKTSPMLEDGPRGNIINLRNGLYFIEEGKFQPHKEEGNHWQYKATIQLPILYEEGATCDGVRTFLEEVFPGGSELLFDLIGVCLTSDTSQHKAVMLLGDGNNGKSVFLYGLRAMVGAENYSSTTLHQLCDTRDRFCNSDLVGKLVNASDDTRLGKLVDTANIKSIISGNPIRMEAKHRDATSYRPFCKMIFATNHRIESEDETLGFLRRFIHIPFTQRFTQNPKKQVELEKMWSDPKEKSGVFNEVIKRLRVTLRDGFQIPDAVRHLVETYDPTPDDVSKWLKTNIEFTGNAKDRIESYRLELTYYVTTARRDSREHLYRFITAAFPGTQRKKARVGDKVRACWFGLKWTNAQMVEWADEWVKYPGEGKEHSLEELEEDAEAVN